MGNVKVHDTDILIVDTARGGEKFDTISTAFKAGKNLSVAWRPEAHQHV